MNVVLTRTAREKAIANGHAASRLLGQVQAALVSGAKVTVTTDWRSGQPQRLIDLGDDVALVKEGDDGAAVVVDLVDTATAARLARRGEQMRGVQLVPIGTDPGRRVYHARGLGTVREVEVTPEGRLVLRDEKGSILCQTA